MKLFKCQSCGQVLYFENTSCERCSHRLGYLPKDFTLSALEAESDRWQKLTRPPRQVRFCDNAGYDVCNWLMDDDAVGTLCVACRHNRTIPDLSIGDNLPRW